MIHRVVLLVLLPRLASSLVACLGIFCAIEFADLANLSGAPPLLRYPLRVPHAFVLVAPVVMLIVGTWACAHLQRTGQALGLACCGADLRRGLLAIPSVGMVIGLISWVLSGWASPAALSAWEEGHVARGGEAPWALKGQILYRVGPSAPGEERGVLAFELDDAGLPQTRTEAAQLVQEGEHPWLLGAVVSSPGEPPRHVGRILSPSPVPARWRSVSPESMSWSELCAARRAARRASADAAPFEGEMGLRAALALACPVTALLGVLAGMLFGRRLGTAASVAAAFGLAFWVVLAGTWALTTGGQVSMAGLAFGPVSVVAAPALAAWIALLR